MLLAGQTQCLNSLGNIVCLFDLSKYLLIDALVNLIITVRGVCETLRTNMNPNFHTLICFMKKCLCLPVTDQNVILKYCIPLL